MTEPQPYPCAATTCSRGLRQHELESGQIICDPCVRAIRGWLAEMPSQMIVLAASMQRETTGEPSRGGTKTAPLPCRIDTINLIGPAAPGTVHDPHGDQHGTLPLAATLGAWVRIVIEERRLNGPRSWTILALSAWLSPHLEWASAQPWAGEFRDELWSMTRAIRGITRTRTQTRPLSRPCPRCEDLNLQQTDHDLYVRCTGCGTAFTQGELNDDAIRRAAA